MEIVGLLKRRPWGIIGVIILLLVVLMAALAPLISPYHYNEISITARMQPPGGSYLLGTDNLGRDIFTRLLYGARPYVEAGLVAVGTALALGALLRFIVRYAGRRTEKIFRISISIISVIIGVVIIANLVIILLSFLPFPIHFANFIISFFLVTDIEFIMRFFAVFTGLFISLLLLPSVYSITLNDSQKFLNSLPLIILVHLLIATGVALLLIAPASFLGFGIPPPIPEWAGMIGSTGRQYQIQAPWMVQWPVIFLGVTVGGFILLAAATPEIWLPRFHIKQAIVNTR